MKMENQTLENDTLSLLVRWGESQPLVRAMVMTSTMAIPGGDSDVLSDYDIELALSDVRPFALSRDWLSAFGRVLVMYQDPLETIDGWLHSGNVTQFEGGLKIDFTLVETGYFASLQPQIDAIRETQDIASLHGRVDGLDIFPGQRRRVIVCLWCALQ